jgi:hypothetical protein
LPVSSCSWFHTNYILNKIREDLLISLWILLNFHKTVSKPLGSNKHNLCVLQSEQCFFLDNNSACSLPLYEEIPRESEYQLLEASRDSEYHMLEASILPEANSLFLLPGHTKLSCPVPPPPAQPRSNRTFFTFHQRRPATQKGDKGGEPGSIPRGGSGAGVNRRRPVATLDIRKAFQLLFKADFVVIINHLLPRSSGCIICIHFEEKNEPLFLLQA